MPGIKMKCQCDQVGKENCPAPLHGNIVIYSCPPNCGLGCNDDEETEK